jgi:hypothetical protein
MFCSRHTSHHMLHTSRSACHLKRQVHTLQKHSYSNNFGHLVIDDLYSAWAGMHTFNLESYDVQVSIQILPKPHLSGLDFRPQTPFGDQVLLLGGCRALFQPFRYCNHSAGLQHASASSSHSCSGCCDRAPYTHELCHKARQGSTRQTAHLTPHTSYLIPHTSHLTPHTSHLTPHTSHLTTHTSHLTPHTSPGFWTQRFYSGHFFASCCVPA